MEDQLEKGSNLDIDIPYQWLRHYMEDEEELEKIKKQYGPRQESDTSTRMLSGQVKAILIEIISKIIDEHQSIRKNISLELLNKFMSRRFLTK